MTFRVKTRPLDDEERTLVLDAIKHFEGQRYRTIAAVVMPDHVHWLFRPCQDSAGQDVPLSVILQGLKGFTARQINLKRGTKGAVWLDESYDRIMRDEEELLEKWNYVRNNAVKAELAPSPEEYPWLWEPGLVAVETQARKPVLPRKLLPDDDQEEEPGGSEAISLPPGFLQPVAYLWTRTVRCKNPTCGATVPLVRQTWLCKKKGHYVALRMIAPKGEKKVRFEVVESDTEKGLGFNPAGFSKAGNATCPFCGTVADNKYVKAEGCAGRMGTQAMAIVCIRPGRQGKIYLSAEQAENLLKGTGKMPVPPKEEIEKRIEALCARTGLTVPSEPIITDAKNSCWTHLYGLTTFGDLFTPRQMLCLLTFAAAVRQAYQEMVAQAFQPEHAQPGKAVPPVYDAERAKAVVTYLAVLVNRQADYNSALCHWHNTGEKLGNTFGRQALPMVWDFAELAPFGGASGSPEGALDWIVGVAEAEANSGQPATVLRGSATALPWTGGTGFQPVQFDAVITDPPYYDNVPYADISDFFYVWLKRTIGHLYPEHFATEVTPKKQEAVADAVRHGGSKEKARAAYEQMMAQAFAEAHRVLKPGGAMVVVYAHKTTLGWSTLVDALRRAGFVVTEAWPLDTEMKSRLRAMESAVLASSILLVARKREGAETGSYEDEVRPELERIVRERVESLWKMGITGADLVIAAVGAGLRAFTRFGRVEYANGEEVPAEKFLAEVECVVLETLLEKIFGRGGSGVATVDAPSRFYALWRFVYKTAEIDAGEAIVFTYGQHVELDGPMGLSTGKDALVEKKKSKYRVRDFTERGGNPKLGLPEVEAQAGKPVPPEGKPVPPEGKPVPPERKSGPLERKPGPLERKSGPPERKPGPPERKSGPLERKPVPLIDVLHRVLWLLENSPRKLGEFLDEARPDRERLRVLAQALAGAALSGKRDEDAQKLISTTAPEQAAIQKLLANWRSLIEGRMAASELPLFDKKK